MKPVLSIIIPLYNSINFFDAIYSEIKTIFDRYSAKVEYILVDDGSTDGTFDLFAGISRLMPTVFLYQKKNGGISSARNYGFSKSSGDFVFFHDHDDFIDIDSMAFVLNELEKLNCDYFQFEAFKVNGGLVDNAVEICKSDIANQLKKNDLVNNMFFNLCHFRQKEKYVSRVGFVWSCIFKSSFLKEHKILFKSIVNYEDDYTFLFQVLINSPSIYLEKKGIYYWNNYATSTSATHKYDYTSLEKLSCLRSFLEEKLNFSAFKDNKNVLNNVLWGFYNDYLVQYFVKNQNRSFGEFKNICKTTPLRESMISSHRRVLSIKQKVVNLLFRFRLYCLIYFLLSSHYKLKN